MLARQFCLQRCHRFRVRHSLICEVSLELLQSELLWSLNWFVCCFPFFVVRIVAIRVGVGVARDIIGVEGHLLAISMVLLSIGECKIIVLFTFLLNCSRVCICHA